MKFDVAIMNPPYNKTLHLQILEKVIPHCEKVVNVSPTGWLHDMTAIRGWKKTTWQKFEDSIAKHIAEYLHISASRANELFYIGTFESNSILVLDNGEHDLYKTIYLYKGKKSGSIFDKVIKRIHDGEVDNIADHIKISAIHGNPGEKDEFDICTPQYELMKGRRPASMKESDFINWHNSCNTKFMKYCNLLTRQGCHLCPQYLPFMGDYSQPWTDERFYEYFKLTKEEINIIETTMKEYV